MYLGVTIGLSGCAFNTGPGPHTAAVLKTRSTLTVDRIRVIPADQQIAQGLAAVDEVPSFAQEFPEAVPIGTVAHPGDTLSVTIWEAPPAALFAGEQSMGGLAPPNAPANGVTLPDQVVNDLGNITVPYAGEIHAAGKTPPQIVAEIVARLRGKANQPQAVVRVVRNASEDVTVVGDVATSTRVPLSPEGERVLDALAAAGGVKQDVNKMTIQLTRGNRVAAMPLSVLLKDPRQNVMLSPGDVLTALYRTSSFTVFGATGQNQEINFEATGLSLAQALGRAGGLIDNRADPRGVFVFRLENPALLPSTVHAEGVPSIGKKVPVIYQINLKDPGAFFVAETFPIRDHDVLYVSNAGYVDLQRFLSLIGSVVSPASTTASIVNAAK